MLDETTTRGRIIASALRLAAEKPWADVTLSEIAHGGGAGLVELKGVFAGKGAILAAFVSDVDDEMLRRAPRRRPEDAARDALFEVVMTRLDVLAPYKAALRSIMREAAADPALLGAALSSQRWMLAAAGISTDGPAGVVRRAGIAGLYASILRTWLDDDDPGHARTMAALDRRLRSGERTLSTIDGVLEGLCRITRGFGRRARTAAERSSSSQAPPPATDPPSPSI